MASLQRIAGDNRVSSTRGDVVLRVEGLSKRYGALWALRHAAFDIRAGEILGLIGPNGSGKTTLFDCVAGVLPATSGTVRVAERPTPASERKHHLFYVPDGIRPWPHQPVGRVLEFIGAMCRAEPARQRAIVEELGLDRLTDAPMQSLSKGEHKRVLLAIGLATTSPILLLDEPFDGLDLRQSQEAMRVLRAHSARGRTLFLSIHQLNDAARVCDRLILLSGGHVAGQGTIDELRERAQVTTGGLEEIFLALT